MKPSLRFLAIIPARGASKGVPRKNLRLLKGKSLLKWTYDAAIGSNFIDQLILSSEDAEIISAAKALNINVPFVRPTTLAADETPGIDVILHAVQALPDYSHVVVLQPTSPLRLTKDIDGAIATCLSAKAPACVSLTASPIPPAWLFYLDTQQKLQRITQGVLPARRQEAMPAYVLNGAVYVAKIDWLLQHKTFITEETVGYNMPAERSVDLDTEADFLHAEQLLH